jgi:hypothetical protein
MQKTMGLSSFKALTGMPMIVAIPLYLSSTEPKREYRATTKKQLFLQLNLCRRSQDSFIHGRVFVTVRHFSA